MTKTELIQTINKSGFKENVINLVDKCFDEKFERLTHKYLEKIENDCRRVKNLSVNFLRSLLINYLMEYRVEMNLCLKCGADLLKYPGDAYNCTGCYKTELYRIKETQKMWNKRLDKEEVEDDLLF